MPVALDQPAVAELGGDRGEVAVVEAERVGQHRLRGGAERLGAASARVLGGQVERAQGLAEARHRLLAEPRHQHPKGLPLCSGGGAAAVLVACVLIVLLRIVVLNNGGTL